LPKIAGIEKDFGREGAEKAIDRKLGVYDIRFEIEVEETWTN
jgi:hypothetical protein